MYRPTFDSHKRFWLRTMSDLVERINANTPWVAGIDVDAEQTVIRVTVTQNHVTTRDDTIRLTSETPLTNYISDREFQHQRQTEMKELSRYLTGLLDAEATRKQHTQLDQAYTRQLKTIPPLANTLSQQGTYTATVHAPKGHDRLTLTVHPAGSTDREPLIHRMVELTHPAEQPDDQVLAAKQLRNDRLREIASLLDHLNAATKPVASTPA